jgi:hypothetical protein
MMDDNFGCEREQRQHQETVSLKVDSRPDEVV